MPTWTLQAGFGYSTVSRMPRQRWQVRYSISDAPTRRQPRLHMQSYLPHTTELTKVIGQYGLFCIKKRTRQPSKDCYSW
jgi:hypothetical protein